LLYNSIFVFQICEFFFLQLSLILKSKILNHDVSLDVGNVFLGLFLLVVLEILEELSILVLHHDLLSLDVFLSLALDFGKLSE
jgi:hypothetical protein